MAGSGPKKATDARIRAALKKHDGMQALTARALKMSRQALSERIAKSQELQQFLADLDVLIVDTAESQAFKKIRKGDGATIRWLLERKGRDRGYASREPETPPPPPNNERRMTVVKVLVQHLEQRAAGVHVQVEEAPATPAGRALSEAMASRKAIASTTKR